MSRRSQKNRPNRQFKKNRPNRQFKKSRTNRTMRQRGGFDAYTTTGSSFTKFPKFSTETSQRTYASIQNITLTEEDKGEQFDLFSKNLSFMNHLLQLEIEFSLDDKQVADIAPKLPISLKELRFSPEEKGGFGNEGAIALANELGRLEHLEKLDLRKNHIGDEGAIALAGVIAKATYPIFKHLYFNDNEIGDTGAIALASKLPDHIRYPGLIGNPGFKAFQRRRPY